MAHSIDRRQILLGMGTAAVSGLWARAAAGAADGALATRVVSVTEFGARSESGEDDTRGIQAAIDSVQRLGGGTVMIPGRFKCGNLVVSGSNLRLQGQAGWLVDGRLTIGPAATNVQVADLGILDTRGDRRTFLLDVSGRNCSFDNVQLVKDPIAGGLQMYLRQTASGCRFTRLRLKGSNGLMVMGRNHLFENFDFEATLSKSTGADDGFAIKAVDAVTENIIIRNGVMSGYGAMVSFGSEIGSTKPGTAGIVRNVTVENVTGDRCVRLAFFKPGALGADYRNGVVEHIVLRNVTLSDPAGQYFRTGIYMIAARGATIRDVVATGIKINARAHDRGVAPTSAIQIYLLDKGAPATIEDVSVQAQFTDPYSGAPHGPGAPGYPVDFIAQIEKQNPQSGSVSGIVLDLEGRGASFGGIHVGPGFDGAISVSRAVLTDVATDPPASTGGGGIWSSSRLKLGAVTIQSRKLPKFGGPAFGQSHP